MVRVKVKIWSGRLLLLQVLKASTFTGLRWVRKRSRSPRLCGEFSVSACELSPCPSSLHLIPEHPLSCQLLQKFQFALSKQRQFYFGVKVIHYNHFYLSNKYIHKWHQGTFTLYRHTMHNARHTRRWSEMEKLQGVCSLHIRDAYPNMSANSWDGDLAAQRSVGTKTVWVVAQDSSLLYLSERGAASEEILV